MSSENGNESSARNLLQKLLLNVTFIVAVLTVFIYLAGRIYTEQYYGHFAVNYRSLDFSTTTYMFNGWNVVSTSIAVLILIVMICLRCVPNSISNGACSMDIRSTRDPHSRLSNENFHKDLIALFVFSIILLLLGVILILAAHWTAKLLPNTPFDLIAQSLCIVGAMLLLFRKWSKIKNNIITMMAKAEGIEFIIPLITMIFMLWLYTLVTTQLIAWNHAERAKNGGMGITIVQLKDDRKMLSSATATAATPVPSSSLTSPPEDANCWWLLLTRTGDDDGRILLYREAPQGGESIFVEDHEIALTRNYSATATLYECK